MGKALVIDGLTVSNPITIVTFTTEVESLTINKSSLSLTTGDTDTITATVVTSDGTPMSATFTSSDSTIASVTANGNTATVTAVASGSVTITVKAGSETVTCSVAVAAAPADELATYYAANQTITQADKTALNTLVTGMSNAGLWAKVKRFYPMLGTSLSDLVLEIKSNSTRGFNDLSSTLQASTNAISVINTSTNFNNSSEDSMMISRDNLAFVSLTDLTNATNDVTAYSARFSEKTSAYFSFQPSVSTYRKIGLQVTDVTSTYAQYPSNNSIVSVVDREAIFSINSTNVDYYLNGSKIGSSTYTGFGSGTITLPLKFLFNGTGCVHKLFMITTSLSETEATALSGLLATFYTATGKRSAS